MSPMVTGCPSICSKIPDEVLALQRKQRVECGFAFTVLGGEDQSFHQFSTLSEEHVFRAKQADLRTHPAGSGGILGVSALAGPAAA